MVVDVLEREQQATKRWKGREKLEVRRQYWLARNDSDRWAHVDKNNTLRNNGGRIIYDLAYEFLGDDRSMWYPLFFTPLKAEPLMMYVRKEGDRDKLWLTWVKHVNLRAGDEPNVVDEQQPKFEYPRLLPDGQPPGWIDMKPYIVEFGSLKDKKSRKAWRLPGF